MKAIVGALSLLLVVLGVVVLAPAHDTFAQTSQIQDGINSISDSNTGNPSDLMTSVRRIINVFLFLIGAVSVIMIIFGGFKYVTSSGESSAVSSAKNTILYAVVGLVIALSAYGIADFVIGAFNGGNAGETGNQTGAAARDAAEDNIRQVPRSNQGTPTR